MSDAATYPCCEHTHVDPSGLHWSACGERYSTPCGSCRNEPSATICIHCGSPCVRVGDILYVCCARCEHRSAPASSAVPVPSAVSDDTHDAQVIRNYTAWLADVESSASVPAAVSSSTGEADTRAAVADALLDEDFISPDWSLPAAETAIAAFLAHPPQWLTDLTRAANVLRWTSDGCRLAVAAVPASVRSAAGLEDTP